MRAKQVSAVAVIGFCVSALLGASNLAAQTINYNASKSNTGAVYFRDFDLKGKAALRTSCAAHDGQIVTNEKGQLGCQVGSLADSKHISDGAAKGQATE